MQYKSSSLSLWIKIRPAQQNSGWTSSEAGASPAILKMSRNNGAGRTWQGPVYKVLRRGKKRNGDDYEPEPLKIMQSAERYLKEKNHPLSIRRVRLWLNRRIVKYELWRAFEGVSQLTRNPGCTFNFFSKDNEKTQPQPQKKRRTYIIESDDEDWTLK